MCSTIPAAAGVIIATSFGYIVQLYNAHVQLHCEISDLKIVELQTGRMSIGSQTASSEIIPQESLVVLLN